MFVFSLSAAHDSIFTVRSSAVRE